jgi:adenosylcobinamide-GDP ribazoletransferase
MFYSRFPTPKDLPFNNQLLNKSRKYFPVVGGLVALVSMLTLVVSSYAVSLPIAVLLSMASTILATGAFHEDGFCDSCDGLGGGWSKEQVLTIMKDSRIGTYGCVGIVVLLGLKFSALLSIAESNLWLGVLALGVAHTVSRITSSMIVDQFTYVQDIEISKSKPITDGRMNRYEWLQCGLLACLPTVLMIWHHPIMALSLLIAAAASIGFALYCRNRIGGYTGDTLGATQQLSELTIYLCFASLVF